MKRSRSIGSLPSVFVLLLAALSLPAATHDVAIEGFAFIPPNLTINPGDTVRWTNNDGSAHTATSNDPLFNSGTLGQGQSYQFTFNSAGTYPYLCIFHPSMQGTIAVNAPANQPPTVALNEPANNTPLTVPASLKLRATAADADGTVLRVEFYSGVIRLGVSVKAPFEITTTLPRGGHSLTAVAYDNDGGMTTSTAAAVTVSGPANVTAGTISPAGANVSVSVVDGTGPFVLQRTDDVFCGVWVNEQPALARNLTTSASDPQRFLRVADVAEQDGLLFSAILTGAAERPNPVTTSATGSGLFRLKGNHLVFNITYSGLSGPATAAHIHGPAAASVAAPILIDLQPFNAGGFGVSGTLAGEVLLTATQKEQLLGGRTYVNVHTSANGGGEIRGQIVPAALQTRLAGIYERPNRVSTGATGFGALVLVGNELSFNLHYEGLSGPATAAHFHGPATVDQATGVLIDLDAFKGSGFGTSGTLAGTVVLNAAQLAAVVDGLVYVNIHTTANSGGEIRGQVLPHVTGVPLTTVLTGDAERPTPVTTSANGTGMFVLEGHVLNFSLRYEGLSGTATAAHIHGPVGSTASAGILINLAPYAAGGFGVNGALAGSIVLTDPQRADLLAGRTYVNIHTAANSGGEIRGQIIPVLYLSQLNGFNERPNQVISQGSGFATAALVGRTLHFNLHYRDLGSTANAAHIHGPADVEGFAAVLVDLAAFNGGAFGTSGSLAGKTSLNTANAGHLNDGNTYFNIHTSGNGNGEIRGQLLK